ncbi:MAG TPA: hemolysin family protein [Candidatus Limnocylindrales bacterium]
MNFPLGEILFLVFLTFLEGFFVAAEIALVSVRRSRIDQLVEEGNQGARRVRKLIDDPGRFLAVAQLGLTLIGFFASAFAAVSLVEGLQDLLLGFGVPQATAETVALIIVTFILAMFTIVFAELIPKSIALAAPERFALLLSRPIDVLARLLGPVVTVLNGITRWVARSIGVDMNQEAQISADELRLIVERGGEQGVLEAEEEQMINAVIELGERRVHEVMIPRVAIAALASDATLEQAIDLVVEVGHSRIPVYHDSIDEIVGILYAKDLLPYLKADAGPRPALRKLLRPPVLVPESMTVDDLLHEFQRRKVHIAIVLDEYGGTAGLVTIEDLLEEIVGEIQDEYDVEEPMVVRLSDHEARVDGRADVDELLELFDLDLELEDAEEYDTVGGLMYHRVGGVPAPGDSIDVDGLRLTVESTDGRRVGKVLVTRRVEKAADDTDSDGTESEPTIATPRRRAADRTPSGRSSSGRGSKRSSTSRG